MRALLPRLLLCATLLLAVGGCDGGKKQPAAGAKGATAEEATTPFEDKEATRLVGFITSPNEGERRAAFQQLAMMGPKARAAVPGLTAALGDSDPRVRLTSAQVLGRIGRAAVPALIRTLETSNRPEVLAMACEAVGLIGPPAEDALPALAPMLKEFDKDLRLSACLAMGRVRAGVGAPTQTQSIEMEEGTTADFARAVVGATGGATGFNAEVRTVNPQPGQTRQLLEQFIPTHDIGPLGDEGKRKAVMTFSVGGDPSLVRPQVTQLVAVMETDEEEEVRAAAAQALGAIGPGAVEAVPDLIKALWDADPVPENAAWALGQIGPAAKEAVPHLQQTMMSGTSASRAACFAALNKIAPK